MRKSNKIIPNKSSQQFTNKESRERVRASEHDDEAYKMVPQMLHSAYKALFLTNLSEIFKKMISVFEANDEDSKIVFFLYFSSLFLMLITNIIDTSQIAIISHNW